MLLCDRRLCACACVMVNNVGKYIYTYVRTQHYTQVSIIKTCSRAILVHLKTKILHKVT